MKNHCKLLVFGALLGAALPLFGAPNFVPNGDFSTTAGATWLTASGDGTFVFSFPETGGNTGGHAVIDHSANDGGFGILISNDGAPIPLATLGLSAGEGYTFFQDMKILSGTSIGGFKVDFFMGETGVGSTGDIFPALIGDGSTWETYSFQAAIPFNADGIKVVPLWGAGSSVGYDNICVDPTPIPQPPLPNGDFENGAASWFELGGPDTSFSYPATGGNPDGYGVMTNNGNGFGIWVANAGAPILLESIGLSGCDLVTFTLDMTILSGTEIGGLKIEFLEGATFLGDTGDMRPALIGDGTTWETYSFEVLIPPTADNIKVVPLWGPGSSVGYDNVSFIPPAPQELDIDIKTGKIVGWSPSNLENSYQPQESADNSTWSDLGPLIVGDTATSVFDASCSPFYRVQEIATVLNDVAVNGDFEIPDEFDPLCPASWQCIGTQLPTRITSDKRSGDASLQLKVDNGMTTDANQAEIQQNVTAAGGTITPGATYRFSFWAKQISSGISYVQQFRVQWLDDIGAPLGGGVGFNNFAGGNGVWLETFVDDLVAPANADTALIQIFAATGAVEGGLGEVLIDDLTLAVATDNVVNTLTTTVGDAVQVCWESMAGKSYQPQCSTDLQSFTNLGPALLSDGSDLSFIDAVTPPAKFYRVELP
ncbi:MAG: hypothetical protein HKN82_16120 [Akkermansiaceae bacterium]|nr:hypothetical protein [Akkermansiaceae bacterium]